MRAVIELDMHSALADFQHRRAAIGMTFAPVVVDYAVVDFDIQFVPSLNLRLT